VEIEVVRSRRRTKTVSARIVDGVLRIALPAWMSSADEARWVAEMTRRMGRQNDASGIDLVARAAVLARRHRLPVPRSIRWVGNQSDRWGSCTPTDGTIRISDRAAAFPGWVLDYVIVHELAHLVELGHGPAFRALEQRYPRAERAIGFLLATGMGEARPAPVRTERPGGQLGLFGQPGLFGQRG
jgi:predicted metal-dependent hydrolase